MRTYLQRFAGSPTSPQVETQGRARGTGGQRWPGARSAPKGPDVHSSPPSLLSQRNADRFGLIFQPDRAAAARGRRPRRAGQVRQGLPSRRPSPVDTDVHCRKGCPPFPTFLEEKTHAFLPVLPLANHVTLGKSLNLVMKWSRAQPPPSLAPRGHHARSGPPPHLAGKPPGRAPPTE